MQQSTEGMKMYTLKKAYHHIVINQIKTEQRTEKYWNLPLSMLDEVNIFTPVTTVREGSLYTYQFKSHKLIKLLDLSNHLDNAVEEFLNK